MKHIIPRRTFAKQALYTSLALPMISWTKPTERSPASNKICVFSKHLQFLPDYKSMAEVAAEIGFDGVDLAVRPGGHVLPEHADTDLPKAVEAVKGAGLTVPMMTTRILYADETHTENLLKLAQQLGIEYYRLGYYKYDMEKGVEASLESYVPHIQKLTKLNQYYQIHGAYQNHDGKNVGAPIWDIWQLIKNEDPNFIGIQYDIRHAVVEGGKSWVLGFDLVKSHIRTLVMKDVIWEKNEKGKWQTKHVPLGEGMVDFDQFIGLLKEHKIDVPISMHFEYEWYEKEDSLEVKKEKTIAAMKRDLDTLRGMM